MLCATLTITCGESCLPNTTVWDVADRCASGFGNHDHWLVRWGAAAANQLVKSWSTTVGAIRFLSGTVV